MIKLFSEDEYNLVRSSFPLPLRCLYCESIFYKEKRFIKSILKTRSESSYNFCSQKCFNIHRNIERLETVIICLNCDKSFIRKNSEIKKSVNNFCSHSCAAIHYNKNKTNGCNRSKLEIWVEEKLNLYFPNMEFHFNRRDAIGIELDIYIPMLDIGIELNGIFHYKPIYGDIKFNKTKNTDKKKIKICLEKGISLLILDVSDQQKFTELTSINYLNKIIYFINSKIEIPMGVEPTYSL